MFANFKNKFLATVISPDMPALPSTMERRVRLDSSASYHQRMMQQQQMPDKFQYARPPFLQLLTADELKASADHNVRPIIVPRDINILPWCTGYAEAVNSGKSEWNEDQAAFCHQILSDPSDQYPDLPYTYFGIFDGHAGYGAALAASHQFHHILHEKLVDCIDLLLPRDGMEDPKIATKSQTMNSFPHPSHFQRSVSKDELIMGALESAFVHMDSLIAQDRDRYRDAGGCTACVSLYINGKMYVSNAGDSRAVLCQRKVLTKDELPAKRDGSEGAFFVPFSFDHTPETERTRLLGVAQYKPHLMGKFYTAMEYAKRPHERDLGQRILCRQGTMKGWTYKTLTREDLKIPVVTGEGKRSRLLSTLGVTRGFGDHDLLAIATNTLIKPFLTAQPDVNYRDLTKIVTIPDEQNEDGDYGILVMATDGLWDVSENEAVARTVFQTLHKYPTEKHRYTMIAQELVAKARGKINDYGHWRLADSKAAATVDDISVIVIPVYQYYKEHIEWEQKCLREYRERMEREASATQATEAKEEINEQISSLVNGIQEMAHIVVEPVQNIDDFYADDDAIMQTESKVIEATLKKSEIQTFIDKEQERSLENVTAELETKIETKSAGKLEEKDTESADEEESNIDTTLEETNVEKDSTPDKTSPSKSKHRKNQRKDKR